jgi:hypothetical protein
MILNLDSRSIFNQSKKKPKKKGYLDGIHCYSSNIK